MKAPGPCDVWHLDENHTYVVDGDAAVKTLLLDLGIPNVFAHLAKLKMFAAFEAFDNHPTHWIVVSLWKGCDDRAEDGLLLEAHPKRGTSRSEMIASLGRRTFEMSGDTGGPYVFSQLPRHGSLHC